MALPVHSVPDSLFHRTFAGAWRIVRAVTRGVAQAAGWASALFRARQPAKPETRAERKRRRKELVRQQLKKAA